MRRLKYISSSNSSGPSFQIVYEWERIISKCLNLVIIKQSKFGNWFFRQIDYRLHLTGIVSHFTNSFHYTLMFVMQASETPISRLNKRTIPVVIDFWIENDESLKRFYKAYKRCPLVLITSLEVYDFLIKKKCPLNIYHWGLSIPDNYLPQKIVKYTKIYDFTFIGRPNPFFNRFIEIYTLKHPDFIFVVNNPDIFNRSYYFSNGDFIRHDEGRSSYIDVIRKTKISCYTTPGLDEGKEFKTRFNQVTPRFLEMLSNGVYLIGHYPENSDTLYYELEKLIPNVNTYEDFEFWMNLYREKPPMNAIVYIDYLRKHATSQRAKELKVILSKNNIRI